MPATDRHFGSGPLTGWFDSNPHRIVGQVYEAADNPDVWDQVIGRICSGLGFGAVKLLPAGGENVFTHRLGAPGKPNGEWRDDVFDTIRCDDIASQPTAIAFELKMNEAGVHNGGNDLHPLPCTEASSILAANLSVGKRFGWIGFAARSRSEDFTEDQRKSVQFLLPHMLRASRLAQSMADEHRERSLAASAVNAVNCGLFHFINGQLDTTNRIGRDMLNEGFFSIENGQLTCLHAQVNRHLQAYLDQPGQKQDPPLILKDSKTRSEYCIRRHMAAVPADAPQYKKDSKLLVSVTRLRGARPPTLIEIRAFAQSYGLSEAEIQVLHTVLSNTGLRDFACARGVTLDTGRKQLKSAMAKMDVSSQKEIFAMFERFRMFGAG
jgi:DNA-binding CsgD family transcriptional regulator